jgi:antitoxin (DNA-binding transcriptional repressor) of toxin-antitoxin stability system
VTLTKHGQPYVDLIPHKRSGGQPKSKAKVLAELEKLRKQFLPSSYAQIKADRDEGRP